MMPLYIVADAS